MTDLDDDMYTDQTDGGITVKHLAPVCTQGIRVPRGTGEDRAERTLPYPHHPQTFRGARTLIERFESPEDASYEHLLFVNHHEPQVQIHGFEHNEHRFGRCLNHPALTRFVPFQASIPFWNVYRCHCDLCLHNTTLNKDPQTVIGYQDVRYQTRVRDCNKSSGHLYAFVFQPGPSDWKRSITHGLVPWLYNTPSLWMINNCWHNTYPNNSILFGRQASIDENFHDSLFCYHLKEHPIWPNSIVMYLPFRGFP